MIRDTATQIGHRRVVVRPRAFIPAIAEDPLAGGNLSGAFGHSGDHRLFGGQIRQADLLQSGTQLGDVSVGVYESGQGRGAVEIDHPRLIDSEGLDLRVGSYVEYAAVFDSDGFTVRLPSGVGVGRVLGRRSIGAGIVPR